MKQVKFLRDCNYFQSGYTYPVTKVEGDFIYIGYFDEEFGWLQIGLHKENEGKFFEIIE